jgi:hypothetical protein
MPKQYKILKDCLTTTNRRAAKETPERTAGLEYRTLEK